MEEDKELNKLVLDLISKLESKGIVAIDRTIDNYYVKFNFQKIGKDEKGKGTITKVGDALTDMGDSLTDSFTGRRK